MLVHNVLYFWSCIFFSFGRIWTTVMFSNTGIFPLYSSHLTSYLFFVLTDCASIILLTGT